MKVSLKRVGALVLVLGMGSLLQACSKGTSTEVPPPPPDPVLARPVALTFIDGATNLPLGALTVRITDTTGAASTLTQTRAGVDAATFASTNGTVLFQVKGTATPGTTLVASATASGYTSTSLSFVVQNTGITSGASMIKVLDPPTGVVATQTSAGSTNPGGTTGQAVTVTTNPEPVTGGATAITIPAATTVTTATGAPLVGALTATVTYNNAVDASSLATFPNGQNVTVGGQTGTFLTIGFATVEITDSIGQSAANFTNPISIVQDIPDGTVDPTTGTPIALGQTIPFWSYNKATAQWTKETDANVVVGTITNLRAVGEVTHLSSFNFGWLQPIDACIIPAPTLFISGNPSNVPLDLVIAGPGYIGNVSNVTAPFWTAGSDLPRSVAVDIAAYYQGAQVGTLHVPNTCTNNLGTLSVVIPQAATANITVQKVCNEDNTKVAAVGSAQVQAWYYPNVGGSITLTGSGFTGANGTLSMGNLPSGKQITFKTTIDALTPVADVNVTLASGATTPVTINAFVNCTQTGGQ